MLLMPSSDAGALYTPFGLLSTGEEQKIDVLIVCLIDPLRRQQGQPLVSGMCVVVQEMVTSALAGVIFTAHPVTGEAGRVTITANWGLGETVVSGKADPDTLIVNSVTGDILETHIGTKMIRLKRNKYTFILNFI